MLRQYKHVGYPGERRIVCDHTRESDLIISLIDAERQRVFDRTLDHFQAPPGRPVGVMRQKLVNQIEIQPRAVRADLIITAFPGVGHAKVEFFFSPSPSGRGLRRGLCRHYASRPPQTRPEGGEPESELKSAPLRPESRAASRKANRSTAAPVPFDGSFPPPGRGAASRD